MRNTLGASLLVVASWSSFALSAEPEPPKKSVLMEKKLEYAQNLLKALITENDEEADRNVKLMKTFTKLEEMYRGKKPEYKSQLSKFQESVNDLTASINAKNYDAASDAYVEMIQSCIGCHRVLKTD